MRRTVPVVPLPATHKRDNSAFLRCWSDYLAADRDSKVLMLFETSAVWFTGSVVLECARKQRLPRVRSFKLNAAFEMNPRKLDGLSWRQVAYVTGYDGRFAEHRALLRALLDPASPQRTTIVQSAGKISSVFSDPSDDDAEVPPSDRIDGGGQLAAGAYAGYEFFAYSLLD